MRLGRSPGEGNGNPLQYSCLENSPDRGSWWDIVHGVAKSQTLPSDTHTHTHTHRVSTVAAPIEISTNSAQGFLFLHIFTNTLFLVFFITVILTGRG